MNNSKSNIYIIVFVCVLLVGLFGMYYLHRYVASYSGRVMEINTKIQNLEDSKKKVELYRKILSKGSKEQEQMNSYILSGEQVFNTITDLEKDIKKIGLPSDDGVILSSVARRENEALKTLGAEELVVDITLQGDSVRIDKYIDALASLPYVSHIEKVVLNFSENKSKTKAVITIIITELI